MTLTHRFIKSVPTYERMIVSYHSPPVPMSMVHESKREPEKNTSDTHHSIDQDPALLVTPIRSEHNYITVAGQVVMKEMCETQS